VGAEADARDSLLRRSGEAADVAGALRGAFSRAAGEVGTLRRRDTRALKGMGILLIALPDPFTDVAGVGVLLAARALSRPGIEDLVEEYRRVAGDLGV